MREHLRFERLISDLSARFVNIAPDEVDREIEAALKQVLNFFQVDRCGLLGISSDHKQAHVTHAAYAEGIEQVSGDIDLAALFPWSYERLVRYGEDISVPKTDEVPPEAEIDRMSWAAMGVRSSLTIPLFMRGMVASLIVLNALCSQIDWPDNYIPRLRLLGEIFVNAIERKRSDQALRESEARLSLAAESAGAMLWNLEIDSGHIWTTEKAKEFFDFQADSEMELESFMKIVHHEDRENLSRAVAETVQSGKENSAEYRIVRSDGSIRWVLSRGRLYTTEPESASRMMGVSIDITERRLMEESLRESQARLASAIDVAALGFYEMNENYFITYADDRVRALLGITAEEIPHGREFWLVHIHPDDLPRILDLSRKVLEGGVDRFATEYRYMHPQRGLTWLHHLSHVLVRDAAGRAVRVIGVIQDITGRKLTEAARMESMERYKAVIEAFDGFIYICSPDYRIEFMNQRLIERTGRDAVGEPCYRVLHDRDSVCEWCVNEKVFQGETVRWEVQSPKDNRWYYVANTPIWHVDGTVSKQAMIMDITERKEAEAELLKTDETLRNNQKDLQRLAGKLISAQEEELHRLSRELHDDLTQRLAVLAIEAGKLEQELNSEHGSRSAPSQKISRIKDQLIEVSQNVHHLARQVHPSILDDLGLVRAIESECAVLMKRDNIEIIFRNEDVPISISNDIALCLYRVVQESLRNVITHSRAKNCEILLKGTDSTLCLAVSDNGVGFDPREIRNKPGLGLSSMRERAHLVRGDFSINTRPGKGTAIRVCVSLNGDGA